MANSALLCGAGRGFLFLCLLLILCGCDSATRYKALSTVFDGVPRLPPKEEYCQDYAPPAEVAQVAAAGPVEQAEEIKTKSGSEHLPFAEKLCKDCHDFQKEGGLIRPRRELCFVCHVDFIQGPVVHGPVAVGDCLACHHPHNSSNPALLLADKTDLCAKCHQEKRLAARMHTSVGEKGMNCSDCHNPHFGNAEFFLD